MRVAVIPKMAATFAFACLFTACFTGIESTPKITDKELRRQNVTERPDQHILDSISGQKPSEWYTGKEFYVTDARVVRALRILEPGDHTLEGQVFRLEGIDVVPSLTGEEMIELSFTGPDGLQARYLTNTSRDKWGQVRTYEIPFMIELDLINKIKSSLVGKEYYFKGRRRFDASGRDIEGLRYIPVTITGVSPGDQSKPVRIFFKDSENHIESTLITLGNETTSLRNFDTQFAPENPRKKYPRITDEVWDLIQHSRVRTGMTPDECRLALGAPDTYRRIPTTAGMVEYWSYNNGSFLTFEDGVLVRFRL